MYEWEMEKDDDFDIRQRRLAIVGRRSPMNNLILTIVQDKRRRDYQAPNLAVVSLSLEAPESGGLRNIASLTMKFRKDSTLFFPFWSTIWDSS